MRKPVGLLRLHVGRSVLGITLALFFCLVPVRADALWSIEFQGKVSMDGAPYAGLGRFLFALVYVNGPFLILDPPNATPRTPVALQVTGGGYTERCGVDTRPIALEKFVDRNGLGIRVWLPESTVTFLDKANGRENGGVNGAVT